MDENNPSGLPDHLRLTVDQITNSGNAEHRPGPDKMSSGEVKNGEAQRSEPENSGQPYLEPHPFAEMFPRMQGKNFVDLVTSIKDDGLEELIVTFEGKILDGRNRYAACIEAGVGPDTDEYKGDDPLGYVLRKNLHRRQLQTSQRAMAGARLATLKNGQRADEVSGTSIDVAANTFSVGRASIDRAKSVLDSGDVELIKAVESGEKSVSAAAKQLTNSSNPVDPLPEDERQSKKLLKLWNSTEGEGQELFLKAIGATR